jgi:hypothetical protein
LDLFKLFVDLLLKNIIDSHTCHEAYAQTMNLPLISKLAAPISIPSDDGNNTIQIFTEYGAFIQKMGL